jgi:hypothetical protein
MMKMRNLAIGTILVLGFAMGAKAQTESTAENTTGDASNYQIGQPTLTAIGDASNYQIGQPDTAAEQGKGAATPAPENPTPMGNGSLNPDDWSVPASM